MEVQQMGFISDALDWAADIVQTMSGEKERRELVQEIKDTYYAFKYSVEQKVDAINQKIIEFNQLIYKINLFRKQQIEQNIICLGNFLGTFGHIKPIGAYCEEEETYAIALPEQQFQRTEDYIIDIDWSQEDVVINGIFLTPIGMTMKTKKQNLSMLEQLQSLQLEAEETLHQLDLNEYAIEQNRRVAELYIYCVNLISDYIKKVIVPELDVVEAFFQTLCLTNEIIAEKPLANTKFKNNLALIQNTQYEKHFLFVKNAFMFYVIACKIYTTPILTRLINGNLLEEDVLEMEQNQSALLEQQKNVGENLMFDRRY